MEILTITINFMSSPLVPGGDGTDLDSSPMSIEVMFNIVEFNLVGNKMDLSLSCRRRSTTDFNQVHRGQIDSVNLCITSTAPRIGSSQDPGLQKLLSQIVQNPW